jgi:hypothetical protein
VDTYLQGRRIPAAQGDHQPSADAVQLILKLRWMGLEEEAERALNELHNAAAAGVILVSSPETD